MTKKKGYEPRRHAAGERNRRKTLHHAGNFKEEAMKLYAEIAVLSERAERLIRLACKIDNRMLSETDQDKRRD